MNVLCRQSITLARMVGECRIATDVVNGRDLPFLMGILLAVSVL